MDDFPEITSLKPSPHGPRISRPGGQPDRLRQLIGDRRVRLAATTVACVALLSCLLALAIPGAGERALSLFAHPTPTRAGQISASYGSIEVTSGPTLLPATGALAPPPSNCPSSPPLDSITAQPGGFTSPVTLYGRSPIWIAGYAGSVAQGTIRIYQQPGAPDPYPTAQIIWEVGPTQYPQFSARVSDIATGEVAWWNTGGSLYATLSPVLRVSVRDPSSTAVLTGPTFFGWPTGLVFTHLGCYKLDVTWSGGEWYTIFAVGGATS